jgi:hypothetical protein
MITKGGGRAAGQGGLGYISRGPVSIGFNGTDTGQDPVPIAFYINGTVCASN